MRKQQKPGVPIRAITGLLVGLCCASPAWAHGAEDSHQNRLERTIPPAEDYELCLLLAPDQPLRYTFSATRKLDFNIHYHAGHEVIYPVSEQQITAAEATFAAPSEQEYCLMWTNPGDADAQLTLEYEKPQISSR